MYAARSRAISAPRFTDLDMELIASHLSQTFIEVDRVFVFQGVGQSSASVVMTTSDESIVERFVQFSQQCLKRSHFNTMDADQVRLAAFEETCPDFAVWLRNPSRQFPRGAYFDILICPPDWQKRIVEMEAHYYHTIGFYVQHMSTREPFIVV